MKRLWSTDELDERWTLTPADLAFVAANADAGKLGLACQLAFWRSQGSFPDEEADLAPTVIAHLAGQIGVGSESIESYAFVGRSGRRHRQLVLDHLAVSTFDEATEAAFRSWLLSDMLPREPTPSALEDEITGWFAARRVVRPGSYRLDRLIRSVRAGHDDAVLATIAQRLDDVARSRLDALLADDGAGAAYTRLSTDPGKPGLDSLLAEIAKLNWCAGSGCRRTCSLVCIPTWSSGSVGAPRSRALGSCAVTRAVSGCRCSGSTASRAKPRSSTGWSTCSSRSRTV